MSSAQDPPKPLPAPISSNPAVANRLSLMREKVKLTDQEQALVQEIGAVLAEANEKLVAVFDKGESVDVGTAIRAQDALRLAGYLAEDALILSQASKRTKKF